MAANLSNLFSQSCSVAASAEGEGGEKSEGHESEGEESEKEINKEEIEEESDEGSGEESGEESEEKHVEESGETLEDEEVTVANFQWYFLRAFDSQPPREHQEAATGRYRRKRLDELSWRGLLTRFFLKENVTIMCPCGKGVMPKKTAQAAIKHIERHHRDRQREQETYFGVENLQPVHL